MWEVLGRNRDGYIRGGVEVEVEDREGTPPLLSRLQNRTAADCCDNLMGFSTLIFRVQLGTFGPYRSGFDSS